jgi:hypothetical protein
MRDGPHRCSSRLLGALGLYPYATAAVALFVVLAVTCLCKHHSEWEDVYIRAANHLRAGETIYASGEGYVYPPFLAMLALPFTWLPASAARLLWYAVSAGCLIFLCRSAWRLSGGGRLHGRARSPGREHLIRLLGLACGGRYALDCLSHQQTDLAIAALVMAGCVALSRSRFWLAATWFGLAAAAKCTPLLWGAYLVWRGRWRPALWLAAVAIGVNLLPNLVHSPADGSWWFEEWMSYRLFPMIGWGEYPGRWYSEPLYNQSLGGAVCRWFTTDWSWNDSGFTTTTRPNSLHPTALQFLVLGLDLMLALAAIMVMNRGRKNEASQLLNHECDGWDYSLMCLLMVLISPMSSKPHFAVVLLPGFCLARSAIDLGGRAPALLLAAAMGASVLGIRDIWGADAAALALWHGTVTWSALLLWAGCLCASLQGSRRTNLQTLPADKTTSLPGSDLYCGRRALASG